MIGHRLGGMQLIFIVERLRLEPPVFLEIERSGAALASSEIKNPVASLAGASHQFPIHEIVCRQLSRFTRSAFSKTFSGMIASF